MRIREGKGKATDKDDEATDDGKCEATDEDDGIIPGCYVLDIGIDGIVPSTLWIHPDYIRIYEALQDHYDRKAKPRDRAPSAVLTGAPGVGESRCFASSAQYSKSCIKAKVFGCIMLLVAAWLKKTHSSGSIRHSITCLWMRASMNYHPLGDTMTSVTSCGLWSIQTRAEPVFRKFSFPTAHAFLSYISQLRPKNGGRV